MSKLQEELLKYNKQGYCPMHMPGHKRNVELLGTKFPYEMDITEIYGFDDLHHPKNIIKQIEEKAKRIYKSRRSFILVNGSTCGILAGIRSFVRPHDKVLVARNCHKSVYHALELNDLNPIYIAPKIDKFGIDKNISEDIVKKQIEDNKDIKLIIITSPTYEGVISDIHEICKIAHKYKIPVLVDEAHGAHLPFMEENNYYEALKSGADVVIQSLHKTLPALTQCSVMHIQGELVNEKEVERQLAIFETSSPSYILMSSIEECLDILDEKREILFKNYQHNLEKFYDNVKKLKHLKILGNEIENPQFYDKGKIVIITDNTNLTGIELSSILRKKYRIEVEMSSVNYVIAMTSICDTNNNLIRLENALKEIDKNLKSEGKKYDVKNIFIPKRKLSIQEALQSENKEEIDFREAKGKVSKEYIWIYPPGIPLVVPGEIITQEIIEKLIEFTDNKIEVKTNFEKFPKIYICT